MAYGCHRDVPRRGITRGIVAAVVLALAAPALAAATSQRFRDVPFTTLRGRVQANATINETARGIELDVEAPVYVILPLPGVPQIEVNLVTDTPMLLTYAGAVGGRANVAGPPWRYRQLPPGRSTVVLDLRKTSGWTNASQPMLLFEGAGHLVLARVRAAEPVAGPAAARAEADRAALWSSEPVSHTAINFVNPPFWSASGRTYLADVIGGASATVFGAVLAAMWLVRRRCRPGLALAAAALFAVGAHGAHAAIRYLPAWNLMPVLEPDARIRDHYQPAAQLGPLTALAREKIGDGERVGVMGGPGDWFGPQTLCFNLAPRPCAIVTPGETEHTGISRIGTIRSDELDVIVSYNAVEPAPPEFDLVASVSPRAVIMRRR